MRVGARLWTAKAQKTAQRIAASLPAETGPLANNKLVAKFDTHGIRQQEFGGPWDLEALFGRALRTCPSTALARTELNHLQNRYNVLFMSSRVVYG